MTFETFGTIVAGIALIAAIERGAPGQADQLPSQPAT
jgi:hypothetical protein